MTSPLKKVLLAGEGKNELGRWAIEGPYRVAGDTKGNADEKGVLESLLGKVAPTGWKVSDAKLWCNIRKYKAGQHRGPETRNVLGLMQDARERKFDIVMFSRDRDGNKPACIQREKDIKRGIAEAETMFPDGPRILGGMAIEKLESWLVALAGLHGSELMREPEQKLAEYGIGRKDTRAMVQHVERADLVAIPLDAVSLRDWLARARTLLGSAEG